MIYYYDLRLFLSCDLSVGIKYLSKRKTKFFHPVGCVIGKGVSIGHGCIIYQNVTIGQKLNDSKVELYPEIGDRVIIGANAVLIGDIKIGSDSQIGAGAVVLQDIPPNSTAVGNPAKVIRHSE